MFCNTLSTLDNINAPFIYDFFRTWHWIRVECVFRSNVSVSLIWNLLKKPTWDGDDRDALIGHNSGRITVLDVEMSRLETPPVEERQGETVKWRNNRSVLL